MLKNRKTKKSYYLLKGLVTVILWPLFMVSPSCHMTESESLSTSSKVWAESYHEGA